MSEHRELFDKFINGSLSEEEQRLLQELLECEGIQREFVEYTVETRSYVSMLQKLDKEPSRKVNKQSRVLPLLLLGAAAIIIVVFSLNLPGSKGFQVNDRLLVQGEKVSAEKVLNINASDGSTLVLEKGTLIEYISYEPSEFILHQGRIDVKVSKQRSSFKIRTEESLTEVLGTEFSLERRGQVTDLDVNEGKVKFSSGKESRIVKVNEAVHVKDGKIYNHSSRYEGWHTWTEEFAKRNDLLLYLNFAKESELNNVADSTRNLLKFKHVSGSFDKGRWQQKMALKHGGYETVSTEGLEQTKEITVWAWVKIGEEPGIWPPVILGDLPHWRLQLSKEADRSHVGFVQFIDGKQPLKQGQWYFLAATFSKNEVLLYTNAEKEGSLNGVDINSVTKTIYVGMNPRDVRIFNGLIDEVAMHKRVLSQEELKDIYNATKP